MKYIISILLIATSLIGKAEKYSFEKGIPTQFQVSENSQIELSPLYYKDGILKSELSNEATKYFSPSEILEKTARIYETIEIINLNLNRYNYFVGN